MTDRLSSLLHDEATTLEVPAVPTDQILTRGRGLQRRRRTTSAVAGAVAAVLIAAVATVAINTSPDDSIQPAGGSDQAAYLEEGAWAVGDEIHIGNHTATVPGTAALSYTSLGVLVQTIDYSAGRDEPATYGTVLVTADGDTRPIDYPDIDGFSMPGTDPSSPYIAYAREAEDPDELQVVVVDLRSGLETPVGEPIREESTRGIPVHLSGDTISYRSSPDYIQVNWRTGEQAPLGTGMVTASGFAGDAFLTTDMSGREWQVRSTDGEVRLAITYTGGKSVSESPSLSPDGRYLAVPTGESGIDVYDVTTGESVHLGGDRDVADYGWTPDDHLVGKPLRSSSEVEVCEPSTGACTGTGEVVDGELTLVRGADGLPV